MKRYIVKEVVVKEDLVDNMEVVLKEAVMVVNMEEEVMVVQVEKVEVLKEVEAGLEERTAEYLVPVEMVGVKEEAVMVVGMEVTLAVPVG